ncbi:MAG: type II secretion system protein [Methylophilaceae bacterium]
MQNGNRKSSQGYVLLGMLCLLIIAGYILSAASVKLSDAVKRDREQELLKVGDTFRQAIGRYYNATPSVVKQYPPNLEALLHDTRFPAPRQYLRKLYQDPVTQRDGWGIVEAPSGGVMGINSLSAEKPFKQKNFRTIYKGFEDSLFYGEWYFVYVENN